MKKFLWIVLFAAMAVGFAGAQEFGFNFQNTVPDFSLDPLGISSGVQLNLLSTGRSGAPFPGNRFLAGLLNMPFGIYSWMSRDWWGGAITAGLQIVGLSLYMMPIITGELEDGITAVFVGVPLFIAGTIYGYVRGLRHYRQNSTMAWTGNPMDHISVAAMPMPDGNFTGHLAFKIAF